MNNEIKVMNNDEIRDFCIKKDLKIFELEQENEKLNNIIKEVREYITTIKDEDIQYTIGWIKQDILEILDKGDK